MNDTPKNKQNQNQTTPQDHSDKVYTQQFFHKGLFVARPRSNSFHGTSSTLSEAIVQTSLQPTVSPQLADTEQLPPPWQRVPITKKRKTRQDSLSPSPTPTVNRFAGLQNDQSEDSICTNPKPENKPPPIILYGIDDLNELTKLIESTINSSDYKYRIVNKNLLRIMAVSTDTYKKIIDLIRQKGLIGHTFTRKDMKSYRIVIRNLHHSTPHDAIIAEIEKTGNTVRGEIINARSGPDKTPTSTFFVNIEPGINNKTVKDIKYIYHQSVKIEDPKKSKTIVQCQRCQQYGHSKNNCMRPYRCVKCGEGHKTSDCPKKDRNTPAKCALCCSDHPANYKGCQVYKEILARKTKSTNRTPRPHVTANSNDIDTHPQLPKQPQLQEQRTYLDATLHRKIPPEAPVSDSSTQQHSTIEHLIIKQSEKIDSLLQQIMTLLGLLSTVISKLP